MYRLENTVQRYAWGSRVAIPQFLGRQPDGSPQAELWMGAHPRGPSIACGGSGQRESLLELVGRDRVALLGPQVAERYGELPFLLKYLAAASPLSIQAHPSTDQARAGYAREERAGVGRDAPERIYKDPHAKPEVLCPVGRFDVLCGFRDPGETARFFELLGVGGLRRPAGILRGANAQDALRTVLGEFVAMDATACAYLVTELTDAARTLRPGPFKPEADMLVSLADQYPGDLGALVAAMLNFFTLEAGEAIFLKARTLHAYLDGVGVELMGNSDNVLRAGLTPKFVDAVELTEMLDFTPSHGLVLAPIAEPTGELVFDTPAAEFRLSLIDASPGTRVELDQWGPDIVLCLEGEVGLDDGDGRETLKRGDSGFLGAASGGYEVTGNGRIARACAGRR